MKYYVMNCVVITIKSVITILILKVKFKKNELFKNVLFNMYLENEKYKFNFSCEDFFNLYNFTYNIYSFIFDIFYNCIKVWLTFVTVLKGKEKFNCNDEGAHVEGP